MCFLEPVTTTSRESPLEVQADRESELYALFVEWRLRFNISYTDPEEVHLRLDGAECLGVKLMQLCHTPVIHIPRACCTLAGLQPQWGAS